MNLAVDSVLFFFQAEDGIRDLVRSRGLGDVYKRQAKNIITLSLIVAMALVMSCTDQPYYDIPYDENGNCLLYTSDAADERSSVDLGGRRIIKKHNPC